MNERIRNARVAQAAEEQKESVQVIMRIAAELNAKMDLTLKYLEGLQTQATTPADPPAGAKPGKAKTEKAAES